jgi:hypothetical protein
MKTVEVPSSGRRDGWVYYMRGQKQCRRRWVKPRDPRTPRQLRSRAVFGAASKAWSESEFLTEGQREAWRTEGAKVRSRPRLAQSGPLTGQLHFVGRNCTRTRIGVGTLLKLPLREGERTEGDGRKVECRRHGPVSQAPQPQRVTRSTWEGHGRAPEGPRCGPGRTSGVFWTGSQCCDGLNCGSVGAGGRWLRQGWIGRSGGGLPSGHGSGGQERLARE